MLLKQSYYFYLTQIQKKIKGNHLDPINIPHNLELNYRLIHFTIYFTFRNFVKYFFNF